MDLSEKLWVEKYRPRLVKDIVLPDRIKTLIKKSIEDKNINNMLFTGPAGTGKTTLAKAFCNELEVDLKIINASDERNIETLRTVVRQFCSMVSMKDNMPRVILFDEGDNLTPTTLAALRGFIESYSVNARFIFTCNYVNKIPDPILSRLQQVDFNFTKDEKKKLIKDFCIRLADILKKEGIEIDDTGKKVLVEFVQSKFPDMRKILNELQKYSSISKRIDAGLISILDEFKYKEYFSLLKEKQFIKMRKWISENVGEGIDDLIMNLYKSVEGNDVFADESKPEAILIISKYMYQSNFVFSKEITAVAMSVMLMTNCKFI